MIINKEANVGVTVDEALKRGIRITYYPTIFIVVGVTVFSLLITILLNLIPFLEPFMILAGIALACFYWANARVRWRLWAFENVRNVHELKARAIKKGLLSAKPNFFTRLERWSPTEMAQWEALQSKFNQPDLFIDDDTVPYETVVHLAKGKAITLMAVGLVFIGVSGLVNFKKENLGSVLLGVAVGVVIFVIGIKDLINRKPQLVLNAEGIQALTAGFCRWGEISNEDIVKTTSGRSVTRYLVYNHSKVAERININSYDVNGEKLEQLLRIYRGRWAKQTSRNY